MTDVSFRQPTVLGSEAGTQARPGTLTLVLGCLAATLLSLVANFWSGIETVLLARGDNDSLLRMVEVRDLLGGQGWFDLHQYRMGPPGGFLIHWSRIIDLPLAAMIRGFEALGVSPALSETLTIALWPTLLFFTALVLLVRMTVRVHGPAAMLPAVVIGGAGLHAIGTFWPGTIDHHNAQITLVLAALCALIEGRRAIAGAVAGIASAMTLGIGMETAPYVAVLSATAALLYLVQGRQAAALAAGYGLGFGLAAGAIFVATVAPPAWSAPACDAFSVVQFALAAVGGLGLAAITAIRSLDPSATRRLVALGLLGGACGVLLVAAFPQCLADPYAGLDPRLHTYWLDVVAEAQPFWSVLVNDPLLFLSYYATPALALVVAGLSLRSGRLDRPTLLVAGLLFASFLVSLWQVRGSLFSITLATIPLAGMVAACRQRAVADRGIGPQLRMVGAWLGSFTTAWSVAATLVAMAVAPQFVDKADATDKPTSACLDPGSFSALALQPTTRVLASSNLGAPILRHTAHAAIAGPYHRNIAGNLVALDAFMGPVDAVPALLQANGITLVAICPGNSESDFLAEAAPAGLMADLLAGRVPPFLTPVDGTAVSSLRLYRVTAPAQK